jgi:hypothetical protein
MLQEIKNEFSIIALSLNSEFVSKSKDEYQEYAQGYNFDNPSINLIPFKTFTSDIAKSGAVRFNATFDLLFLTKFSKTEEDYENVKDQKIDNMIFLSERFFSELNKNQRQVFDVPQWTWRSEILRQYTSNLLCGVKVTITLNTACNRLG